jgi:hypothetical protein
MNRFQLYRLLRKNINISYKRSPIFEQNKWAKVLTYFGCAVFILYLIMFGFFIAMDAKGEAGRMISFMPIILAVDFYLRLIFQTTPSMMVKPYILQPISRYTAIECFLVSSHVSGYNFLWLAMFIPYSVILFFAGAGIGAIILELIASILLIILNSQIYLFFRTLINRKVYWFLGVVLFYAIPFTPLLFERKGHSFRWLLDMYTELAGVWYVIPVILILLTLLFMINRHFQFKYVYEEISKKGEKALKHVSQFSYLNRFGLVGEYLKIEMKSNMRNKTMKSRCISSIAAVTVFSFLITYTGLYNDTVSRNYWCIYCFAIYSAITLVKIMGQEGNYIDLLMTHKENIITLLEAKYWFYSAVLGIPFLIMMPALFSGKYSLLMLLAYMFTTAGLVHFIIFQLAVYNKQTLPLQTKLTSKENFENGIQLIIETAALLSPGVIAAVGGLLVGMTWTYVFMIVLGLGFILTHPIWIRNIYKRMMARRYENLEGFHTTRQ